ncbi:MAG: Lrp/AsnC ligand binding domain-containing protein [Candidatus Acidiferrales bacterium]
MQQPRKGTIRAYILIHTRAGRSKAIVQELLQLPGVRTAHALWGVPDVIAFAEVGTQTELDDLVMEKIQTIEGIERTDTHIAL